MKIGVLSSDDKYVNPIVQTSSQYINWVTDGSFIENEFYVPYSGDMRIEDSIFLRKDFAKAYGQEITDYSNKYLVAEFSKLCEEYLDKQILFGI